jgi:hypothetical protein
VVDSTINAMQSNPLVAVGPNRELAIVFNDGTGYGKLLCYKSTDQGNTFVRVVVDSGYFRPPWYQYFPSIPEALGFDHRGQIILMAERSYLDDIVVFTNYYIGILHPDSTKFTTVWTAVGTGGPGPPIMKKPTMVVKDSVLHALRGLPSTFVSCCKLVYTRLSGERWTTRREHEMFYFPNSLSSSFDGKMLVGNLAVHGLVNKSYYQSGRRNMLFYSYILHGDSVPIPMISVDTVYATSPRIADLGSGSLALLYAAGNGVEFSDTALTVRFFSEGDTAFSSPFRLTAKPKRAVDPSSQLNSPVMHSHGANRHLVYRGYSASSTSVVAYYMFGNLRSPPLDSAFFTGYDYGDLALDSLGGKYLVMVGPAGKIFLTKKDVISSVKDNSTITTGFNLGQNYPNPFNPITVIRFHVPTSLVTNGQAGIPNSLFVTLKVYDVLGREVATLVNEAKGAGEHEIVFDASGLASGFYFYRLRAGSFHQTRKMVLLQ